MTSVTVPLRKSHFSVLYIMQKPHPSARKDKKSKIILHPENNYITINQNGIVICMEWPTSLANGSGLCWVSHQPLLWTGDKLNLTKITQTCSWVLSQCKLFFYCSICSIQVLEYHPTVSQVLVFSLLQVTQFSLVQACWLADELRWKNNKICMVEFL